jgi:EAL domain-containing protein (putative c-di-GMP-specific phosphodiesterase class I)/FixJ family two-component response regulator
MSSDLKSLQGDAPSVQPALLPDGSALTCFIVDDEPAIQNLLVGALAPFGCKPECYRSAQAALVALKRTRPHVVFLDVSLEGSDAVDVIRGLSEAKFRGRVLLISGKDPETLKDLQLIGERHSLSMLPPLQKPFRINAVRQIIQENISELFAGTEAAQEPVNLSYQKLRLADVLQNNWFQLWYQPKIDIQRMKPIGAEALTRCIHPELGLVMPDAFISGADNASLAKLGERVLIQSLHDWPLFNAALRFPFKLSINLSIDSLTRIPVAQIVRDLKPKDSNWPGMIVEITEDQAIKDIHVVHEIATQLKLYGISIAIDDFGSGYSHLARLKELPFAELKIDRSLVKNCDEDPATASLCRMAIELAHKFNTVAVAEGIEKPGEVRALQQMGCDLGQGYLFAKATQRDKLIAAMKKRLAAAPV